MTQLTDTGTRLDRYRESLAAARRSLTKYEGTPCEQDYIDLVARFERRVATEAAKAEASS